LNSGKTRLSFTSSISKSSFQSFDKLLYSIQAFQAAITHQGRYRNRIVFSLIVHFELWLVPVESGSWSSLEDKVFVGLRSSLSVILVKQVVIFGIFTG